MLDQLQIQLRKKVRDLKTIDSRKASEVSRKADDVAQVAHDCVELFNELTCKSTDQLDDRTLFIAKYYEANKNILIKDVMVALQSNGYPIDWIQQNPDQILDTQTFVLLIICSEKQGNRNVKSL